MAGTFAPPPSAPPKPSRRSDTLPDATARAKTRRRRRWTDRLSRYFVGIGGISVIVALTLIFIFLFLEVLPLLRSPSLEMRADYLSPGGSDSPTLHLAIEQYREVAVRFAADGSAAFFDPADGSIRRTDTLPVPDAAAITSVGAGEPRTRLVALGLSDGSALIVRHAYDVTFPDDVRLVTPRLEFPLEAEPVPIDPQGSALTRIAVQDGPDGGIAIAASTDDGRLHFVRYQASVSFMTGEVELERQAVELAPPGEPVYSLAISTDLHDLIVADDAGRLQHYVAGTTSGGEPAEPQSVVEAGGRITAVEHLLGTASLLVGSANGDVAQWMLVRGEDNTRRLTRVREFEAHGAAVSAIRSAHARKGFVTADESGQVALHFSTSHRTLVTQPVSTSPIRELAEAPRGDGLLALDDEGHVWYYEVDNPHPQFSLSALWGRVWYEGRDRGEYLWQSSSATDEFEPKFSLVPLTLGTVKAAFYAMLFAVPLAVMGAIYAGYFMSAGMRRFVKPTIEVMEALPTVILGFLAGLWFSPFVENHLPAVFSVLLLMPFGMLAFGLLWRYAPEAIRGRVGGGLEAALLVPVIVLIGWASVAASPLLEIAFFDGSMRQWFTEQGITYDQRNALVVGAAMGFAVIPTVFSIAEDAIFNVPKHLSEGSLALGATPWQTMSRVVLLTASPGIFAAVMIGLGRAVGETMIVLMATGNSPVVNFNIFEGMRTLSANIAVEMPETEVGGTHYRIIFLSALLLFVLTFLFNTVAEVIRQKMRRRYSAV